MSIEKKTIAVPFEYEFKQVGDEEGIFEGLASPFGGKPDDFGDIIDAGAFKKTLRQGGRNGNGIAMLWQHESHNPIGIWITHIETEAGLEVKGRLAVKSTQGLDAFELMKIKALKGLSIGFEVNEFEENRKTKIRHLKEISLWEISPVTFPAQVRATITDVKSAIENAKNEKELEDALREAGLSNKAALYVVSLCKPVLFSRRKDNSGMKNILTKLQNMNSEISDLGNK